MSTQPVTFGSTPPHNVFAGGTNMNPTGTNGTGGITPAWGGTPPTATPFAPPTGSPGNYGYGAGGNANPVGVTTPTMNPTGSPAAPVIGATTQTNQLNSPLGSGLGPQVETFLQSNGGYNSALTTQAVEAQAAEMQKQSQVGMGNLESGLGAAGINPNSSAAALETSNYESNVTTAENAMTAQEFFNMWQSSMSNETSVLEAAMGPSAQRQQQQYSSGFDWANLGMGIADTAMSAAMFM